MTFQDFNITTPLLNALDDMGITTPTPIQIKTYNIILSGKDLLGIAQTGTGKTLAYLLPSLRQWQFRKEKHPQILIVVPTRELVVQIVTEVEKLTAYMSVRVGGVYGGANMNPQALMVDNGLDVLVGTPGRLLDLCLSGILNLRAVKRFIIDEVDEMLDLGFRPQLMRIFEFLPTKRQNLMFSATMTESVEDLIHAYFEFPEKVEAAPSGAPLENIEQSVVLLPNFHTKVNYLERLLRENEDMSKVVVFTSTRKLADWLFGKLDPLFPEQIGVIHSNRAQGLRFATVNSFQDGQLRVLVATDLIARGIDLSNVTHVINLDTPDEPQNYMHRIGRTGRAEKKGIAITLVADYEEEYHEAIEELMQHKIAITATPEDLEISDVLLEEEKPQVRMKVVALKLPKKDAGNAAFHEKSAKRQKVNKRTSRKDVMMKKYGKPQKRKPKK